MDKNRNYYPSVSYIAKEVAQLEGRVGVGVDPLVADDSVIQLQDDIQNLFADSMSEVMIGVRTPEEIKRCMDAYNICHDFWRFTLKDLAYMMIHEGADTDSVKHYVFGYLQDTSQTMVARDYAMRLEKSSAERTKEWVARHKKARRALPFVLSTVTTGALLKASEIPSSFVEITPTQGGIMGIMALIGGVAIRSAFRSGPRQVGSVLKNQFNASLKAYTIEHPSSGLEEGDDADERGFSDLYAARHLAVPFGAIAIYLVNYDIATKDDVDQMVEGLLEVTRESILESYGINLGTSKIKVLQERIFGS